MPGSETCDFFDKEFLDASHIMFFIWTANYYGMYNIRGWVMGIILFAACIYDVGMGGCYLRQLRLSSIKSTEILEKAVQCP